MDEQTRFEHWRKRLADAREADAIRTAQAAVREHQNRMNDRSERGCGCDVCNANEQRMSVLSAEAAEILAILATVRA